MLCLDTNIIIGLLSGRNPALRAHYAQVRRYDVSLTLSTVAYYELRVGVARSSRARETAEALDSLLAANIDILPFTADDASDAADIRAGLEREGTPIGPYDILIAAQARRRGVGLVTLNTREFNRVPGLTVVDWSV